MEPKNLAAKARHGVDRACALVALVGEVLCIAVEAVGSELHEEGVVTSI
jgi:hypothetical protein